jgi:hypothetical protein
LEVQELASEEMPETFLRLLKVVLSSLPPLFFFTRSFPLALFFSPFFFPSGPLSRASKKGAPYLTSVGGVRCG